MTKPAELEKITTEGNGLSELKLIWGVTSIAALIGRTERQTFHMLQNGLLPARKVGDRWVVERSKLINFFTDSAA